MKALQWLPGFFGSLGPVFIPPAHMAVLWTFWQSYARFVDRRFCSCSCWDTVFKGTFNSCLILFISQINLIFLFLLTIGTYESGVASYKHMYFNATQNTMKMWILTVVSIISLYESTKHLVKLIIKNNVRYSMIVLFCLSIYSHYYAWWAYVSSSS